MLLLLKTAIKTFSFSFAVTLLFDLFIFAALASALHFRHLKLEVDWIKVYNFYSQLELNVKPF